MKNIKIVSVQTDKETGDGIILLEEFKDFVDTSKVDKYQLEEIFDSNNKIVGLSLKFFDKDGNQLNTEKKEK